MYSDDTRRARATTDRDATAGLTRRQSLGLLAATAATGLAGCTGDDGTGSPAPGDGAAGDGATADGDGSGGTTAKGDGGETTGGAGDDESGETTGGAGDDESGEGSGGGKVDDLTLYRFERPETYTFETVDGLAADGASGRLVVDVTEADGETASVDLTYEYGDQRFEDTVSGPVDEDLQADLMLSRAGGYFFSMGQTGIANYLQVRETVTVGDVWETGGSNRLRVEITERATLAGVEGYRFVTSLVGGEDEGVVSRGVYSPDLQVLPEFVMEGEEGETALSKTLVEYERR
ncbi:hypothetical protein [Halomarina litorea]|uniref:hypothetical protein n=1 Tax=Halomarina litorea TaxID=2961595 RepID=UPI0020C3B1BF|nr:hypothetical protein [Halomarina sp. BCD28]